MYTDAIKEKVDRQEDEREQAAKFIEKNRGNKKRRVKKRQKVLTFSCPNHTCQETVQLVCPFCRGGAVFCDEKHLHMNCNECHNTFHFYPCHQCGFEIRPSYVRDKQKELRKLQAAADGSKFFAIIGTIMTISFILWSAINIYNY